MRASKSKRFSTFLYNKGLAEVDIVKEVENIGFRITYELTHRYTATLRRGPLIFQRVHSCHFRLAQLCYSHWKSQTITTFQSQVIKTLNMTTPLTKALQRGLEERGVEMVRMAGFRHSRPAPVAKLRPVNPEVKKAIASVALPRTLVDEVEKYHHSSCETNIDLMVKGYTVLHDAPPLEADFDDFYHMFIRMALEVPEVTEDVPDLNVGELLDQPQPSSSCGLLPLNSLFGACQGSKKEMHCAASAVNQADVCDTTVPGCIPNKPVGKDEVIKKGKKVRTIMVESQANGMVLRHYFEKTVSLDRDIPGGKAIGLSSVGGGFKMIVMRWFQIVTKELGLDWNAFLTWLSEQPINESDKKAWESSTNELDGLPYVIFMLLTIRDVEDPTSQRLLSRALADYINPPVQLDGDLVAFAPWRVASGSYFTAHGNTYRHWFMGQWVCDFIERHQNRVGCLDCVCKVCVKFKDATWFAEAVTPLELQLMRAFFVMGDDFIGLGYHMEGFNAILDYVFGTTTVGHEKRFFSEPSLAEPEGCEFLKKHFHLDKTFSTWNVRIFRAPGRLLAKLLKGRATQRTDTFRVACLSALWEIGYNRQLYEIVRRIMIEVPIPGVDVKKIIAKHLSRVPALEDLEPTYVPEWEVIVNSDASLIRPLETVYWAEALRQQHGVTIGRYN